MKVPDEMQAIKKTEDKDTFHSAFLTTTEISNKIYEIRDESTLQKQRQRETRGGYFPGGQF